MKPRVSSRASETAPARASRALRKTSRKDTGSASRRFNVASHNAKDKHSGIEYENAGAHAGSGAGTLTQTMTLTVNPSRLGVPCTTCPLRLKPAFKPKSDEEVRFIQSMKVDHRYLAAGADIIHPGQEDA